MPKQVDIRVYNIGRTMLNRDEVRLWLADLGVSSDAIEKLVSQDVTDCANLVRLMGKRCYMAFEGDGKLNPNVMKVRDEIAEYVDNILKSKHGSVIEHVVYNFAIEGISRVLTAELNRHRAGVAISEGSMRYIRFKDIQYWLPNSVKSDESDSPEISEKKRITREIFENAFKQAEENYDKLENLWSSELAPSSKFKSKKEVTSMMRRVVPIGVSTGGCWSFNFRALRHVCTMRCDQAAEEEINELAVKLLNHMMKSEIHFFNDFSQDDNGFWHPKYNKV